MRKFDFYEFAGVITPGAITLIGSAFIFPSLAPLIKHRDLSAGDLGVFAILAYVTGHLTQAVGNVLEQLWWRAWGGWPTDWVRSSRHDILSPMQISALESRLQGTLAIAVLPRLPELTEKEWSGFTRQVYAAVAASGRSPRVDTFNANYGLCRGIVAGFVVVLGMALITSGAAYWQEKTALAVALAVSTYRMHRFAKHYARELFVQFLQLPQTETKEAPSEPRLLPV